MIADPGVMASQPLPGLAESAMNALAHALEALYTPRANPFSEATAIQAACQLNAGFADDEPNRPALRSVRCWPAMRSARAASRCTTC